MQKSGKFLWALVITVLFCLPGTLLGAEVQKSVKTPVPLSKSTPTTLTISGKILHDADGYVIRGETPAEIFRITNPDPATLDAFVESDQPVSLRVRSVVGDNVAIESIDGLPYPIQAGQ